MNKGVNDLMQIKLDNETKKYLEDFQQIHINHKEKYQGKKVDFSELIADLGNFYIAKRIGLKENFSGDELSLKLEKLEIAFTIYNEEKVVGEVKEVGTMANEVHFTLAVAKSDRYIKEAILAVKSGKSAKSAVKRDITLNDKETVSNILEQGKKVLGLVVLCLNRYDKPNVENSLDKLNEYTKENLSNGDWSFSKLMKTFELLDKTKGAKEERYTPEKFGEVIESSEISELFSVDEKNVFIELFRIYN